MQAQEALNEDALVDEQDPETGDDLNDSDIENQAPINHIGDYMKDYIMDKNKSLMKNFWTKVARLLRKHIGRLRSRVLRNTMEMLFVNFQRCEVQEGLKLFV